MGFKGVYITRTCFRDDIVTDNKHDKARIHESVRIVENKLTVSYFMLLERDIKLDISFVNIIHVIHNKNQFVCIYMEI